MSNQATTSKQPKAKPKARFKNGLAKIGPYWYFYFRLKGKQWKGTTHCTDKEAATLFVTKMRNEIVLGEYNPNKTYITFEQLGKKWVQSKKGDPTYTTSYVEGVRQSLEDHFYPRIGSKTLDTLNLEHFDPVFNETVSRYGKPLKPASVNALRRTAKLILNYAVNAGYLKTLPFKIKIPRLERKARAIVPQDQIGPFVDLIDQRGNVELSAQIRVLFFMGMRESEVMGMRWEWLDLAKKEYTVRNTKSKKPRTLTVPPRTLTALLATLNGKVIPLSGYIFPMLGEKRQRGGLYRRIVATAKELDLGHIGVHRLRATFATLQLRSGVDIKQVCEMLGHSTIGVTEIYLEEDRERQSAAITDFENAALA